MSAFPSEGLSRFASLDVKARSSTLVRALAELFVHAPEPRPGNDRSPLAASETVLFEELFLSVYNDADEPDRAFAARLLASRIDLPVAVASLLARDTIAVAGPFLAATPAIPPLEMTRVICLTGPAHREVIARRPGLDPRVVDALLYAPDRGVAAALAANPAVEFSEQQINRIRAAVPADTIPERLLSRPAESEAAAPRGATLPIDSFFELAPTARAAALATMRAEAVGLAGPGFGPRVDAARRAARRPDLEARLKEAAFERDRSGFAAALADGLALPRDLARRIVDDPAGEPLVVALGALGLDARLANSLLLWVVPKASDIRHMRELAQLFDLLGWRTAETIMARWRARSSEATEVLRQVDPAVRRPAVPQAQQAPAERRRGLRPGEPRRA
jgi:uncharacterized protein (DUF2336 family)